MARTTLLHVAVAGGLLTAATFLFVQGTTVIPAEHVRTLRLINALNQNDTELRRIVLLVRGGLLHHYDSLNEVVAKAHRQLEALSAREGLGTRSFPDEVVSRLDAVADNVAREEELLEQFKSNNALVRNSWAYFTQRSRSVSTSDTAWPEAEEFSATIGRLFPAMLRVLRSSDDEATATAARLLNRLEQINLPGHVRRQVDSMVVHGRLVLNLSPELETTLKSLLTADTATRIDAFRDTYLEFHQRIEDRAERHRILLYLVSLLLLAYLGYLFFRLHTNAKTLARLNNGLMEEMAERKLAEERTRALQADLAHTHRLSVMGEMASGLAHELNQPMTAIRIYAEGCARRFRAGKGTRDEILTALDKLSAEVLRAGEIVAWIRGFVGKKRPQRTSLDVNAAVREAIDLLGHEFRSRGVAVRLDFDRSLPNIEADRIEIQQIVLNLARNSMEAMNGEASASAGLTISTSTTENGAVEVAVRDTGPGIPPEHLDQVCNSFFTTKANGLGLGLSICRSMVEAHGGCLWVTSKLGIGSTFHFTLPIDQEEPHDHF